MDPWIVPQSVVLTLKRLPVKSTQLSDLGEFSSLLLDVISITSSNQATLFVVFDLVYGPIQYGTSLILLNGSGVVAVVNSAQ